MKLKKRNKIYKIILCLAGFLFADQMALTSDGKHVILKDDGRWMYYQNNSKIRDIRPSALPEDAKANVFVKYDHPDKLKDFKRRLLEVEGFEEEAIRDSLRVLPKGGIIRFCIPAEQIHSGRVRYLTYTIWGDGKQPVFSTTVPDSEAVESDDAGILYLLSVPVYKKPKGKSFKIHVEDKSSRQTLEFDLPIEE